MQIENNFIWLANDAKVYEMNENQEIKCLTQSPKLDLCIIIRDTKLWKKGQKVWIWIPTGALAALVVGRFKGKGRWISGWVRIETAPDYQYGHKKPTARWVGEVEVSDEFFAYYQKIICRIVGNDYYFKHGL